MNEQILLLKTMLTSSSNINVLRHSDDKKKRSMATGNIIGFGFIYLLLAMYTGGVSFGMSYFGLSESVPVLPATIIFALSFFLTLFKAHGILFGFKEIDLLMSMPFTVKNVVSSRFLFVYIENLKWTLVLSFSSLIGYIIGGRPSALSVIIWVVLTFFLPVIPMLIAALISALVGGIGAGFKHKNIVLTILTFILVIPLFFVRFFIEDTIKNNKIEEVVTGSADAFSNASDFIPTAKWFSDAVNDYSIPAIILIFAISITAYEVFFFVFSKFYKRINSKLSESHTSKAKIKDKDFRAESVVMSICFKEAKRFTGSVAYMTNIGMGAVMSVVFGIAILFINVNKMISSMAGVEVDLSNVSASLVVPVLVYFFTGMVPSTACSMSLEGKNYWIIQTLPVKMMDLLKGKMLFNIFLFLPVGLFATVMSCISLKANFVEVIVALCFTITANLFSTAFGMLVGVKNMQLDWENEIQVIKQGRAVASYLLPNMFGTMFIGGGAVALGIAFKILPITIGLLSVVYLLLAILFYSRLNRQMLRN